MNGFDKFCFISLAAIFTMISVASLVAGEWTSFVAEALVVLFATMAYTFRLEKESAWFLIFLVTAIKAFFLKEYIPAALFFSMAAFQYWIVQKNKREVIDE